MNPYFCRLIFALLVSLLLPQRSEASGEGNPSGVAGEWNGSITTGGSYDPYTGNASRVVEDIAVAGSVGAYPLKWTRTLNTRATSYGNRFGNGGTWTHSYDWRLSIHPAPTPSPTPNPTYEGTDGEVTYPDGRVADLYEPWLPNGCPASATGPFGVVDRLVLHSGNISNGEYDLLLGDGGKVKFRHPPSSNFLVATEIVDPYGQVTDLIRNAAGRLEIIKERLGGRYLKIGYWEYPGETVINKVEAFDGLGRVTQTVRYEYTEMGNERWYLTKVYYGEDNETSPTATYAYYEPGNTHGGLIKSCNDVRYTGPMKYIKYEYLTSGEYGGEVPAGQIKREKNVNDEMVSEVAYPQLHATDQSWRRETRPGNNITRSFKYGNGFLAEFSDFSNPPNWSRYSLPFPSPGWDFTDARLHTTHREGESVINAPILLRHPAASDPSGGPGNTTIVTTYSDPIHPYYVSSRKNENGKTTFYQRDGKNRVERINYPDSPTNGHEEFTYNEFDQILTHTMRSGGVENFWYDNRGLKTLSWPPSTSSDEHPEEHPTQYFYYGGSGGPGAAPEAPSRPDLIDRLRRVIDPRGYSTWYEYNKRGQVTRVTHHDTSFTESSYNPDGTLAWTKDELGHTTSYIYDEYARVTQVTNHLGEHTNSSYDPPGALGPLSHTTASVYSVTSHFGRTDYDYDNNFRRKTTIQAPGTADAATSEFIYDEVGNLWKSRDPRQKWTAYGYDERNRQISVRNEDLDETTVVGYDPVGNKVRETRPDAFFRTWDYDAMNQLRHAHEWRLNEQPHPDQTQTTTYTRDPAGNATLIKDTKGAVYSFVYDKLNRKESATNPSDGSVPARTEVWHYDVAGNVDRYTNPDQKQKHYHYDNRNRQDHSWWDGGIGVGQDIVTAYDEASRVRSITTNGGETIVGFGYDEANRKVWEDQTLAGQPTRRITTELDEDGRRENLQIGEPLQEGVSIILSPEMKDGGPYSIVYRYTARSQVWEIDDVNHAWTFTYSYDLNGNMTERKAVRDGSSATSSSTSVPHYDALNRPTVWEQSGQPTGPNEFHALSHYEYDKANRERATWRDEDLGRGERFAYEATGQLAKASYNAQNVSGEGEPQDASRTVTYAYTPDKLNRSSVTESFHPAGTGGQVKVYTPNALNQYTDVGGVTYQYDNNFNLTSSTAAFYAEYDAANRLVSASNSGTTERPWPTTVQFVYDGLGRCVARRTVSGPVTVAMVFAYDGWKPIAEWEERYPDSLHAWNVYGPGPDEILLRNRGVYDYIRFHLDRHGNVAFLTNNDGRLVEKYKYDAFGQPTIMDAGGTVLSTSSWGHSFLFQGREYIPELGIYDYRHRFYMPSLGRFLQTDPTGFGAGDMNLFRYCGDDPIDRSDPFGLEEFNNLQKAIDFVRAQVKELSFGPNAHKESKKELANGQPKTHGVGVGISRGAGGKFVTSKPIYGEFQQTLVPDRTGRLVVQHDARGRPVWHETETYPAGSFMNIHGHNDKTGLASYGFSTLDYGVAKGGNVLEKITESDGAIERIGPSAKRPGYRKMNASDPIKESDYRGSSSDAGNGVQTASEIDARQQAAANWGTGVPSLGAEAVNVVKGPY